MSEYLIAIAREDGGRVHLKPGGRGERDLVHDVVARVKEKGVGFARTEAHVLADVEAAVREAIVDIKSEVLPRG